jgi:hypothetical protein
MVCLQALPISFRHYGWVVPGSFGPHDLGRNLKGGVDFTVYGFGSRTLADFQGLAAAGGEHDRNDLMSAQLLAQRPPRRMHARIQKSSLHRHQQMIGQEAKKDVGRGPPFDLMKDGALGQVPFDDLPVRMEPIQIAVQGFIAQGGEVRPQNVAQRGASDPVRHGRLGEGKNQTIQRHHLAQLAGAVRQSGGFQKVVQPQWLPYLMPNMDRSGLASFLYTHPVGFNLQRRGCLSWTVGRWGRFRDRNLCLPHLFRREPRTQGQWRAKNPGPEGWLPDGEPN